MKKVHINMCPILDGYAGRNTGCRSVVNCARYQPTPTLPAFLPSVEKMGTALSVAESMTPPAVRRGSHKGVYGN